MIREIRTESGALIWIHHQDASTTIAIETPGPSEAVRLTRAEAEQLAAYLYQVDTEADLERKISV